MALAISLTLSTAAPVLAADADEVQTPAAQTEQQETDTEADEAAALPELSEDREVAEEDEAAALPELSEDREVAEEDEAAALPELSEDREVAEEDEPAALPELSEDREVAEEDEASLMKWDPDKRIKDLINKGIGKVEDEIRKNSQKYISKHEHVYTIVEETVSEATCTKAKQVKYRCNFTDKYLITNVGGFDPTKYGIKVEVPLECNDTKVLSVGNALGHDFDEEAIAALKPCQTKTFTCRRDGCNETKVIKATKAHTPGEWEVLAAPTCTENGKRIKKCTVCGEILEEDTNSKDMVALDHDFKDAEWIIEPATCTTPGKRYQVCKRDGCNAENVDKTYTEEHPALGHVWGKHVDDDKPGCQQQTATAHCTREGCTATHTEDWPNFGPDGNPLPHKYTTYEYVKNNPLKCKSTCDYGCGTTKEFGSFDKDVVVDKTTQGAMDTVKVDDMTADERANQIIDDALKAAQEAVKQAKTKKEAIAALDQISATVKSELSSMKISVGKLNKVVSIDPKDLENVLKPLDTTIDSLKDSLDDSFLSQETITSLVNKLAGDVQDSSAPQAGIKQILHNTVYDAIYNLGVSDDKKKTTDNTQAISDMVLQLVKEVVQSDKGWNDLTGSLVDDAVDLAVDELMKDKTYAKLLKTKLGAATMEEVRAEVKKQLVEDPEFMNQVRGIASKAVDNAQKGVNAGWSNEKIMNRLQADLLPDVTDLISNQVNKLGASAGDIVDNKVSDTVHKFLPGKLGDWVSDKIGGKVNDAVTGKVDDLNKQVTDLISTTIKQLTCTHQYGSFTVASTCTHKGKTGEICNKCGKTRNTKDIEELAPHTPVVDAAVAPTETSDGLTEGSHCGVCGVVLQAQEVIPMLDPTIDTWFSRAATTEADAKAAGFDSVDAANAALDAALVKAGFSPIQAEHFTVQVNSSIGVLPNDRFSESGVTGKLTLPEGTRGKTAQTYYAVQMFTADTRFHKSGDVVVTPVSIDTYAKTGLQFTVYSEAVMAIAWKAQ